jgi:circadian clock protein KaiC
VVLDPVSNLQSAGGDSDATNMLIRLVDFLRRKHITGFFTSLTAVGSSLETTDEGLSSMVDTWLLLRDVELNGERNRVIYVLKSRGMAHSNQLREFTITARGVKLVPAYLGAGGVLTGSARLNQEAVEKAEHLVTNGLMEGRKMSLEHRRKALEAKLEALRAEFNAEKEEYERVVKNDTQRIAQLESNRQKVMRSRHAT